MTNPTPNQDKPQHYRVLLVAILLSLAFQAALVRGDDTSNVLDNFHGVKVGMSHEEAFKFVKANEYSKANKNGFWLLLSWPETTDKGKPSSKWGLQYWTGSDSTLKNEDVYIYFGWKHTIISIEKA